MTHPSPGRKEWDLGSFMPLLRLMAWKLRIDRRLRRRFDASDIVNEAMVKACECLNQFQGNSEAELLKWLQAILHNTFLGMLERQMAGRRSPEMEASIQDSSACLDRFLEGRVPSPSHHLLDKEFGDAFLKAVELLPDDQRDVVILRLVYDLPVREIAEQTGRTEKAVAGLLLRGKVQLARTLKEYHSDRR